MKRKEVASKSVRLHSVPTMELGDIVSYLVFPLLWATWDCPSGILVRLT